VSYCTRDDIEARLGYDPTARLADADMDGHEDVATLEQAIADVSGYITSRIARRWPAYVDQPTDILTPIAVDLVAHRLARGPMRSDDLADRAKAAEAALALIASGDAVPHADEAAPDQQGAGEVVFEMGRREFGGGGF
jgi:phage gp36-like protein